VIQRSLPLQNGHNCARRNRPTTSKVLTQAACSHNRSNKGWSLPRKWKSCEDADGSDVALNSGASREHFALCRCGHAQNKPFCTGMHWYVDFQDPVPDSDAKPMVFQWAGGLPAFTRMTRIFYEKYVPQDDLLAPLFAYVSRSSRARCQRLAEVFCGPHFYSTQYGGYPRMLSQHLGSVSGKTCAPGGSHFCYGLPERLGFQTMPNLPPPFQSYIEWGSRLAVENSQPNATPPMRMPMPHWDWSIAAGPPGSRVSSLRPQDQEEEPPAVLPGADETLSFAKHIKPLFRRRDRQSMQFVFDLWAYSDVSEHADAILERLGNGSMPCDGAWTPERIAVSARWIASKKPE